MGIGASWFRIHALLGGILVLGLAYSALAAPPSDPDFKDGYIGSLDDETEVSEGADVILVPKPPPAMKVPLGDVIFDLKIKKEFIDRYREKFGYTEVERNFGLPILYSENGVAQGHSVESENARADRRAFAEYMFRRLAEHHMDSYFRSDPNLKSVWELKERISNVEVKVSENFTLMTVYSYSGNFITVNANNPYANLRLRFEMNPSSFGPSEITETIGSVIKVVTPTVHLESHYRVHDGMFTLVGMKALSPGMSATLSGSVDNLPEGTSPQQNLVLAGFAFVY